MTFTALVAAVAALTAGSYSRVEVGLPTFKDGEAGPTCWRAITVRGDDRAIIAEGATPEECLAVFRTRLHPDPTPNTVDADVVTSATRAA